MKVKNESRSKYQIEQVSNVISKATELDYLPPSHGSGAATHETTLGEVSRLIKQGMKGQHSKFIKLITGARDEPRAAAIQKELARYRTAGKKITNTTELKNIKSALKQALLTGIFFHCRQSTSKKDSISAYTGLAVLDFDDLPAKDMPAVARKLRQEPDCIMYFRSPTGRGLKVVITLNFVPRDETEYKELYMLQTSRYETLLSAKADQAQATAKCYLSFDSNSWVNPKTVVVHHRKGYTFLQEYIDAPPGQANAYLVKDCYTMGGLFASGSLSEQFRTLEEVVSYITDRISLRNKGDVQSGLHQFHEGRKKPFALTKVKGRDFQTLYKLIGDKYDIAFDEFQRKRVIIDKESSEEISEEALRTKLRLLGFGNLIKPNVIEDVLVTLQRKINVLHEFFEMELHDGKDYIKKFSDCVKLKDESQRDFFTSMFRKHLVRGVRGCYPPYMFPNRYVFVLVGGQGIGKSSWLKKLGLHNEGIEWGYCETSLTDDKDSTIRMSEFLMWNIEELQTINRMDIKSLKKTISASHVNQRAPYAKKSEKFQRVCTFFGSTNDPQFLIDDANTRWLVFEVDKLDFSFSKIDAKKIWRQAYALWKENFVCELSKDESILQSRENEEFKVSDELRDVILELYEKDENEITPTFKIFEELVEDERLRYAHLNSVKVGQAMASAGFSRATKKVDGTGVRGWKCRKKPTRIESFKIVR